MQTLLVFGVDRVVGANVITTLADRFQVAGIGQRPVKIQACPTRCVPSLSASQITQLVQKYSPNWIVYAGALAGSSWDSPPSGLEQEPELAAAVLQASQRVGARLTYVSTDAVFCGPRMFHDEEAPLGAAQAGRCSLAAAAAAVEDTLRGSDALLVRTHAYGWSPRLDSPEFAEWLSQALEDGQDMTLDPHCHASPILATDLAELLYQAWRAKQQGTLHLAGAERTSPTRFASELASVLGLSWRSCGEMAAPPADQPRRESALIARRARQTLGVAMPMLREGLDRFVAQASSGYRDRFITPEEMASAA